MLIFHSRSPYSITVFHFPFGFMSARIKENQHTMRKCDLIDISPHLKVCVFVFFPPFSPETKFPLSLRTPSLCGFSLSLLHFSSPSPPDSTPLWLLIGHSFLATDASTRILDKDHCPPGEKQTQHTHKHPCWHAMHPFLYLCACVCVSVQ